jgi:hypothetical protein
VAAQHKTKRPHPPLDRKSNKVNTLLKCGKRNAVTKKARAASPRRCTATGRKNRMVRNVSVTYATAPTLRGDRALMADVSVLDGPPADLLVWMHSGGFRTGSRQHGSHAVIARRFALQGIATAFIDYRLARPPAVLRPASDAVLPALQADARTAGEEMPESFWGARPLAVVEDACAFMRYAQTQADDWNLSGKFLVGGSSAGAISALNTLWLPQFMGLERPAISTVLAFSGGFAYPSFRHTTGARIYALHNPADTRVPISSIRRLAARTGNSDDPVTLIEDPHNIHGDFCVTPQESVRDAIKRIAAFHRAAPPLTTAAVPKMEQRP